MHLTVTLLHPGGLGQQNLSPFQTGTPEPEMGAGGKLIKQLNQVKLHFIREEGFICKGPKQCVFSGLIPAPFPGKRGMAKPEALLVRAQNKAKS